MSRNIVGNRDGGGYKEMTDKRQLDSYSCPNANLIFVKKKPKPENFIRFYSLNSQLQIKS